MLSGIAFIKGSRWANLGSAYLRADQLHAIVSPLGPAYGLDVSVSSEPERYRDTLLVLNKTFLMGSTPEAVLAIRRRGNVVAADFIDLPVSARLAQSCDLLISSSYAQDSVFRDRLSDLRTFRLSHHADLRIRSSCAQGETFRAGYFGAIYNATHVAELAQEGLCDFHSASAPDDPKWLDELCRYSCHYAVRSRQGHDGFKPFTKGAIAAACGAVVVTTRDQDTVTSLGTDYPFFAESADYQAVREAVLRAREAFGSATWDRAKSAMARLRQDTSCAHIRETFAALLKSLGCSATRPAANAGQVPLDPAGRPNRCPGG